MDKGYYFTVACIPYDVDLIVSVMQTDAQFIALMKRKINPAFHYGIPKSFIGEIACQMGFDNGQQAIRFTQTPDMNTLTHEVFHAVCNIFRRAGIVYSTDSEEAFAYLIGYVNQEIFNKLKE